MDVIRCSGVDTDCWHVPLLTRKAEGGVETTGLDRPVGKGVRLIVGGSSSTRLVDRNARFRCISQLGHQCSILWQSTE